MYQNIKGVLSNFNPDKTESTIITDSNKIRSRIKFCSCTLVNTNKELKDLYGINTNLLQSLLKRNSPHMIEIIRFMKALNIFVETDTSPYVNLKLKAEHLKNEARAKRAKIKEAILKHTQNSGINKFIHVHQLDKDMINKLINSDNSNSVDEIDEILELFEFFNIKLDFNQNQII